MKLHDLMPNEGSKHVSKRKVHGISAGQGKTAGRGTKGLGARAGSGGHLYRQGGNLPFYRHLPFMRGQGFTPPNQVEYNVINLEQLAGLLGGPGAPTALGASGPAVGRARAAGGYGGQPGGV